MWLRRRHSCGGNAKFFRIAVCHDNLKNYFETNFALMQHHKYSLFELENLLPWERSIYIAMLVEYIRKENERIKLEQQSRKR